MGMTCNIDAKGKRLRLIGGITTLIAGVVLLITWTTHAAGAFPWIVSIVLILGGAFMIFEARAGWCAIRAMGFKTPV